MAVYKEDDSLLKCALCEAMNLDHVLIYCAHPHIFSKAVNRKAPYNIQAKFPKFKRIEPPLQTHNTYL